jgi:hypothetical protein
VESGSDAAYKPHVLQVSAEFNESRSDIDDNNKPQRFFWHQQQQRQTVIIILIWQQQQCGISRPGGQRLFAGRLFRFFPIGDDRCSSDGDAQRIVIQRGR